MAVLRRAPLLAAAVMAAMAAVALPAVAGPVVLRANPVDDDGRFSGYVDLGGLGVADRWADLAPALMSLGWNYGPGWQPAFLDAYGIEPDESKRAFYAALWDGVADQLDRR